jgi:Cu2+-exporting ATPase
MMRGRSGAGHRPIGARGAESWLRLDDIYCAACVGNVERALHDVDGVLEATVYLGERRAFVRWDPERTDAPALFEAVRRAGYEARPDPRAAAQAACGAARRRVVRNALAAAVCAVPAALAAAWLASRVG